jgi:hypothetical protein
LIVDKVELLTFAPIGKFEIFESPLFFCRIVIVVVVRRFVFELFVTFGDRFDVDSIEDRIEDVFLKHRSRRIVAKTDDQKTYERQLKTKNKHITYFGQFTSMLQRRHVFGNFYKSRK